MSVPINAMSKPAFQALRTKVEVEQALPPFPKVREMWEMQIGEYARLKVPQHGGEIVLRTYMGFVLLEHPWVTWDRGAGKDWRIEPIGPPGSKIIITVGE